MAEFRDDAGKNYINSFKNVGVDGFANTTWQCYVEDMICTDPFLVHIRMSPPKAYLIGRSSWSTKTNATHYCSLYNLCIFKGNETLLNMLKARNDPMGSRIRLQLTQKLGTFFALLAFFAFVTTNTEPRKLAHQILTIREGIGKEIIFDLKSIKNDNAEAVRYANQAVTDGPAEAEKKRRLTRMSNEGESTPLREKNFLDLSVLIINLAFDLVKGELAREGSLASLNTAEFLNEFICNCSVSSKEDAYERLEEERKGNG